VKVIVFVLAYVAVMGGVILGPHIVAGSKASRYCIVCWLVGRNGRGPEGGK
jgi:hypothetical protein